MLKVKMLALLRIAAWFVLLAPFHGQALAQSDSCKKAQVFFVNGVWNPEGYQAMQGSAELSATLNEALDANGLAKIVNVRTIWNVGDGFLADLEEVALEQPRLAILIRTMFQGFADAPAATARRRQSIDKIKELVLNEIQNNEAPVVLLAHSQGNIYVNQAVRELRDEWSARLPQVANIAVVGIGVADRNRDPLARFYSFITSTTDTIINLMDGVPKGNFVLTTSQWLNQSISTALAPLKTLLGIVDTEHPVVTTYLNSEYKGLYKGDAQIRSSREIVGELFVKSYASVLAAWPCVTVTSRPNPSALGVEATFEMTVKARPGDPRTPGGTLIAYRAVTVGNQNLVDFCAATVNSQGEASCTHTFVGEPRTEKVVANYLPASLSPFETWSSPVYEHTIGKATPTIALSADPLATDVGTVIAFSAAVSAPPGANGMPIPSGTITFRDSQGTTLCISQMSTLNGIASCDKSLGGSPRVEVVSASYSGDYAYFPVSNGATTPVQLASYYWSGTMKINTCTQPVGSGYGWAFENPCFTAGPSAGQYSGFIRFKDGDSRVVLGSNFGLSFDFTREDYSATFDLNWRSSDNSFYFERGVGYYSYGVDFTGRRRMTLTVTSRVGTTISGVVNISSDGSGFYQTAFTNSVTVVPTTGVGTFTLQLKQGELIYP